MLSEIWDFLQDENTRTILGWVGGGLAAAIGAGWALYTHFHKKPDDAKPSIAATASTGSVAAGGNVTGPIHINALPEQLAPLVAAATGSLERLTAQQQATIGDLQHQLGISEGAVRAFFRILGEEAVPRERWMDALGEIAERFKRLQQDLAAASGDTPEITRLKQDARTALDAGDLQCADDLLQRVLVEEDRAIEQRRLQAAATAAQRGEIAMTRLRYRDAAGHFASAAARMPPDHAAEQLRYLDAEANALYRQGDEFGDNKALQKAIERYQALLSLRPRDEVPLDWAATQNNLGNALWTLGERESGTARLQDAVTAYRAALQEYTRAHVPLNWATTQNNLGGALWTLALRTDDLAMLQDARAAVDGSFEGFMQAGQEHHRPYFEERLQAIDRDIATLSAPQTQRAGP